MTFEATASRLAKIGAAGKPISPLLLTGIVRTLDLSAIIITSIAAYFIYLAPIGHGDIDRYIGSTLIGAAVSGLVFHWAGLYDESQVLTGKPPFRRALSAWAIAFAILLTSAFALKISASYSRVWAGMWFFWVAGLLILCRFMIGQWVSHLIRERRMVIRTVIYGAGKQGQRLAASLDRRETARSLILGFIDDRRSRVPSNSQGYDVLGDLEHLIGLIRSGMVDQVYIALPWSAEKRITEIIFHLSMTPVDIRLAPDLAGLRFAERSFVEMDGLPMLRLFDRPISGWSYFWKSLEDRCLALLLLPFTAPLMLLVALAVKLDSPGPILFKQKRYGFNNQLIEVWKFRTMHTQLADPDAKTLVTKTDPRVTRVGRFLRKSSLDELPQLLNVIRGDMSLVGPRPHALSAKAEGRLYQDIVDKYAARHRVKPGITGWAQVNGWRGETDTIEKIQKRVEHDLYYIENWSVWIDLRIIFKTAVTLLKYKEAH